MGSYDGWNIVEELGEGGQGTVYKVRSPQQQRVIDQAHRDINNLIRLTSRDIPTRDPIEFNKLAKSLSLLLDDPIECLGAMKVMKLSKDIGEREKARKRLETEISCLRSIHHDGVLKLRYASSLDLEEPFMVTEFHPNKTLSQHLTRYKGKPLEALRAFLPLVEAVEAIHGKNAIHRDIKPQNIFVASDGRLVLGDFGIALFIDASNRMTSSFERVGTRSWMAPWAMRNIRLALENVNPGLDIFPLAKVLWSMLAADEGFWDWDYTHQDNDLRQRFPDDPGIVLICDQLFAKCLVRDEANCLASALELRRIVEHLIGLLERNGDRLGKAPWKCRMCGVGKYQKTQHMYASPMYKTPNETQAGVAYVHAYDCDLCGHIEYFRTDKTLPITTGAE